jgi:hypothetical protein
MKHDPLRNSDNAILRLAEGSQLGLDRVVGVGHGACWISQSAMEFDVCIDWADSMHVPPYSEVYITRAIIANSACVSGGCEVHER